MVNGQPKHVVSYMKDFLFTSEQARTPLGKLSGGERGRLMPGAGAGQALEPPGPRRADQRSRHGNAGRARGDAGEYAGHRPAHQPRSRFSRPAGQRRDRPGRATAAGSNMPAATATCWCSAAPTSPASRASAGAESCCRPRPARQASPAKSRMSFMTSALECCHDHRRPAGQSADALLTVLEDPQLYRRDRTTFEKSTSAFAADIQKRIAAAEEQWLET